MNSSSFRGRRHKLLDVLAGSVLFLLPLLIPGWALFTYDGLLGSDRAEYHRPYIDFHHEYLSKGIIPFWNPYVYGGTPEFGNPERAPMYPPNLVLLLLCNPEMMLKLKYLFHLGLMGLGMFLFLRALSLGSLLAFAGGLTLEMSGFPVTKIALPNVGDSAAWIPLMLFFNLWFSRRPCLRRGLIYALAGGCCALLFFPQNTLTMVLLLFVLGAARYVKIRTRRSGASQVAGAKPWGVRFLDRLILPLLECVILVLLLRHPPEPVVYFPDPGWRRAFNGMGLAGLAALSLLPVSWLAWVWIGRLGVRFDWRGLGRWTLAFGGVWAMAAAFAAPQLAVTGEMILHSNQGAIEQREAEDFFTGAQAYGSTRAFIEKSALAQKKESVNNMALGPFVYFLVSIGILGGFHRRHRLFFLLTLGAALTGAVYLAAPVVFDAFIRLPFFKSFSGLSRYLAFLNIFLIILAMLAARLWIRRFRGGLKTFVKVCVFLGILVNLVFLGRHEFRYFSGLRSGEPWTFPEEVARMVGRHLGPGERFSLDMREAVRTGQNYQPYFMLGMDHKMPSLETISPMRLLNYDLWQRAHNDALGVNHDDYRAGFFEPVPTAWLRAMRVGLYLYPPGAPPLMETGETVDAGALETVEERGGWTLKRDPRILPAAWPESNLERSPPLPKIPEDWRVAVTHNSLHRKKISVYNPGAETWMVLPQARYPGWMAWIKGDSVDSAEAYGFLQAFRIPAGRSDLRIEYRPLSFALGWLGFLWTLWVWVVLFFASRMPVASAKGEGFSGKHVLLALAGGPVVLALAHKVLTTIPDSFSARYVEVIVIASLVFVCAWLLNRILNRSSGRRPLS